MPETTDRLPVLISKLREKIRESGYVIIGPSLDELSDTGLLYFAGLVHGTWMQLHEETGQRKSETYTTVLMTLTKLVINAIEHPGALTSQGITPAHVKDLYRWALDQSNRNAETDDRRRESISPTKEEQVK